MHNSCISNTSEKFENTYDIYIYKEIQIEREIDRARDRASEREIERASER